MAITGVALVAIAYLLASLFAALSLRWEGSADAYEHLDYVLQVSEGGLPDPVGHVLDPAGWDVDEDRIEHGRQYASAHPPLYYWIAAALVGPLIDVGQTDPSSMVAAVLKLRLLNIGLGLAGLVFLAWGGWTIGGRLRGPLAIALPSAGAFHYAYLRFAGEVYGDMLLGAASAGAIVLAARVLLRGPTFGRVAALTVLTVIGMGSKATFILVLLLVAAALVAASIFHTSGPLRRRIGKGSCVALLPVGAAAGTFGWFYARNVRLSGVWYRSTPVSPVGERPYRTLLDNLTEGNFYMVVPGQQFGRWLDALFPWSSEFSIAVFVAAGAATIAVWIVAVSRGRLKPDPSQYSVIAMVAALLVGAYGIQLSHSVGYGAYNARYFLPATLATSLLWTGGIVMTRRGRVFVLPILTAGLIIGSCASMVVYDVGVQPLMTDPTVGLVAVGAQGVAPGILAGLVSLAVIFAAATAVPLWRLRYCDLGAGAGDIRNLNRSLIYSQDSELHRPTRHPAVTEVRN